MTKQTIYRIETGGPFDQAAFQHYAPHVLGYATGDPDDIRQFYQATGITVQITELSVPHITAQDAKDRIRLEDLIRDKPKPSTTHIRNEVTA